MGQIYEEGFDPNDLSVRVSELLVATADASDELIDRAVSDMLVVLRERTQMDVVFVSEFVGDKQVFHYVDASREQPVMEVGGSELLERTWCQRVVDGRLPEVVAKKIAKAHQHDKAATVTFTLAPQ